MPKRDFRYSDFSSSFTPHPTTGDIAAIYDIDSITRSLKNLLLTRKYDRLHQPYISSGIQELLFDLATPETAAIIERRIEGVIENYEDRVELVNVFVNDIPDQNRYKVSIKYKIRTSPQEFNAEFFLERVV